MVRIMLKRKQLILNLIIRILIFIMLGIFIYGFSFLLHPNTEETDMYAVKGKCVDIYKETIYVGRISATHEYIVMDENKKYRITQTIDEYLDVPINSLIGKEIVFFASYKSIWSGKNHPIVAWSDTADSKEETLTNYNEFQRDYRILVIVFSLVCIGPVLLIPQILRISEERDERMGKVWAKEKKAAKRRRIEEKNLPPLSEQKKRPRNMSKKKWEQRKNKHN